MSDGSITVVLADDQQMVRDGFRAIIDSQPDMQVVGEAENGEEAVTACLNHHPKVCLLDIRMPGTDGLQATRDLHRIMKAAAPAVVIVTTFDLDEYVFEAFQSGARGFVTKDSGARLLLEAVRAAATGDALVSPDITLRLIEQVTSRRRPVSDRHQLKGRELDVLQAVAEGLTNDEIAAKFYISLSTVKAQVTHLLDKLGARNRVELTIYAYEHGLTDT